MEHKEVATVAQLDDFDEVIDVRSPGEFAADHIPGAVNYPVLNDAERARVGTLYQQVSPLEAKRIGAVLVARNIAAHIEEHLDDRPRNWRPLIYCWRGGGRSDAMSDVLRRIGWRAARLDGGYRAYRRAVVRDLNLLPVNLRFWTLCGRTGTGKSRVLHAAAEHGAQALDLESLACHRGSVLGDIPGTPQPTQKSFESRLWSALRRFDTARPVLVEAESRKVGNLQVPAALLTAIRASRCVILDAPIATRIALLRDEYRHFLHDTETLQQRLGALRSHYGHEVHTRWIDLARHGRHTELVADLLSTHYDPSYDRSIQRNFARLADGVVVSMKDATSDGIEDAVVRVLSAIA